MLLTIIKKTRVVFCMLFIAAMVFVCTMLCAAETNIAYDWFSGRYVSEELGAHCYHAAFIDGMCNDCGFTCVHDWQYNGDEATCSVCGKVCTSHETAGLDFNCATCGYDSERNNAFNGGASLIADGDLFLNKHHKLTVSFNVTFGSADTVVNVKDASRNDNIYYSEDETASTPKAYFSVFTWINNSGSGDEYLTFASLWIDTDTDKLYLVKTDDSTHKICEIKAGVSYTFDVEISPTNGRFALAVEEGDEEIGTYSGNFNAKTKQLTKSQLRFGEAPNAKRLHVQKVDYLDISVEYPTYLDGVCTACGTECTHIFNAGGHCVFCEEFGNPITFVDGQNGGGNSSSNNGVALTVGSGVYIHDVDNQLWDYRDTNGTLLGRDYVFSGRFTFTDWEYVSSNPSGTTRFLIWSNGDVSAANTKFALYLFGNNENLEIGPDERDVSTRMTLESGYEYDIRVAVRSKETYVGNFTNTADIYVNGELMWTRSFNLTKESGMSIRLGDHTPRQTQVKYTVAKDFGIHCLEDAISFIGTQEKENANYEWDPTYDIRFVFGIDDIYLDDVGVKVEAEMTGGQLFDNASGELTASSSSTVLTGIMANGKICKPGACGSGYGGNYLALAITDISLDASATYTFTLTPYVVYNSSETVFSKISHKVTVSFTDYKMNIAYEK